MPRSGTRKPATRAASSRKGMRLYKMWLTGHGFARIHRSGPPRLPGYRWQRGREGTFGLDGLCPDTPPTPGIRRHFLILMKRGEIRTIAGGSHHPGKPRPALILQNDRFREIDGLRLLSWLTADKIFAVPKITLAELSRATPARRSLLHR